MNDQNRDRAGDLERLRIPETKRTPKRHRRRWPYIVGGIVVVVVVLSMLTRPTEVRVASVQNGGGGPAEAGGTILTANGYVEARHEAAVAARTTGRLAEVKVEEGDAVDSNQVVARMIDEDQIAGVNQAEANLALARARLDQAKTNETDTARKAQRRTDLFDQKQISEEEEQTARTASDAARADREAAEATLKVAQASLQSAELELDKTRIHAPFAGVVLRKDAEVGEIVGPIMTSNTEKAGAVVTIADMKTLEVGVDVNESYIARIFPGMPCDLVLDAYPEVHFPGEVRAIYPSADRDKATIPVRIRFLLPDARVRPDLGAKVTFMEKRPTTEIVTVKKALRIPLSALRTHGAEQTVWVVKGSSVAPVTVTVGEKSGDKIEVLTGLAEGDQVVADGAVRLHKGMRVRPVAS